MYYMYECVVPGASRLRKVDYAHLRLKCRRRHTYVTCLSQTSCTRGKMPRVHDVCEGHVTYVLSAFEAQVPRIHDIRERHVTYVVL